MRTHYQKTVPGICCQVYMHTSQLLGLGLYFECLYIYPDQWLKNKQEPIVMALVFDMNIQHSCPM